MAFTHILVPYDESDHARNALTQAKELIEGNPDAKISVVEIVPPPENMLFGDMSQAGYGMRGSILTQEEFQELCDKRAAKNMEKLKGELGSVMEELGDRVTVETISGMYVAETIIKETAARGCDLICMGCRGLGALRGMLGSVSFGVLRSADTPVLVVK